MSAGDVIDAFPLRDYALVADGERGALIDPRGEVAWLCAPRWHDPALFCGLLGGRGRFAVTPVGRFVWGGYYEPGSLIWRSRWVTGEATIECREALARPARPDRLVLLRRIIAREGTARVDVVLRPRGEFDRRAARLRRDETGGWRGRCGSLHLEAFGLTEATDRDGLRLRLELEPGQHHDLVLAVGALDDPPDPDALWAATAAQWEELVPPLGHVLAPRDARHAVAVLHGLTSTDGGMVAAATMSLPERYGAGRSYDYRYAWIRDQCYVAQAAAAAGVPALLDDALAFVRDRLLEHGPDVRPAYTVNGGPVPDESPVRLPGFPGGTDRTGNWVNEQFQLDVFGEALLVFAAGAAADRLDSEHWAAAHAAVAAIAERWQQADAGIWELEPREWTHSRLSCAAGLRALASVDPTGAGAAGWSALADAIVADCSRRALHADGRWQRAPDDPRVDAALLLGALRGAVPIEDARSRATRRAVLAELAEEHFAYRFRHDGRTPGSAEGAFLLCGVWVALAGAAEGEVEEPLRWFERTRGACGPPGLFSEEFDVGERQLRGNLPQAFVHAGLLEAAATIAAGRE